MLIKVAPRISKLDGRTLDTTHREITMIDDDDDIGLDDKNEKEIEVEKGKSKVKAREKEKVQEELVQDEATKILPPKQKKTEILFAKRTKPKEFYSPQVTTFFLPKKVERKMLAQDNHFEDSISMKIEKEFRLLKVEKQHEKKEVKPYYNTGEDTLLSDLVSHGTKK
eukprot:TRINITY_DN26099_c0_g1_i1.p1 TRINITY_DN26099_c0_g1~~TRINITY_DN26099_c0_g1_i1.p1  ORF type:complete len:167 (+),score=49.69 TRINITY_DN26099_c0_g1_i1:424-924(+)